MAARITYCCLVDNTPKLLWEGALFRRAIVEIAGVAEQDVVIHFTPGVPEAARAAVAGPCRTRSVAPFDLRFGFANKVTQLAAAWDGTDAVAFLDADMIVLVPLDPGDVTDTVAGVPVFGAVPDEVSLRAVYRRFGPERAGDWLRLTGLSGEKFTTHRNNLNGGLYLVPTALIASFGQAWALEARRLLADPAALEGAPAMYADQIAAGAALARLGLRAHHLSSTRNCPPPLARRLSARVIHDFGKFSLGDRDAAGNLRLSPELAANGRRQALARLVDEVNSAPVGQAFFAYRSFRFALYADEFSAAERRVDEVEAGPFPFPRVAADMRVHLAAYQRMASRQPLVPPAALPVLSPR